MEDLDKWSAIEVMGWESDGVDYHEKNSLVWRMHHEDWRPSDRKTGQIWLVIDKMQELGWVMRGLSYNPYSKKWTCLFFKFTNDEDYSAYDVAETPCIAILKAAKAAVESAQHPTPQPPKQSTGPSD